MAGTDDAATDVGHEQEDEDEEDDDEIEEDPLCDYDKDQRDEAWVNDYLMLGYTSTSRQSDATLNCPCCFSLLCLDCQQHDIYPNQFRAMFVKNCVIDFDRWYVYQPTSKHCSPLAEVPAPSSDATNEQRSGYYHKVRCSICGTDVAVFDSEEVFHFYHTFPSEPPVCRDLTQTKQKKERKKITTQTHKRMRTKTCPELAIVDTSTIKKTKGEGINQE